MQPSTVLRLSTALALLLLFAPAGAAQTADVLVYGDSAAAVTAAVQVARMGKSVLLVSPARHIGGFAIDGLGGTDINNHWFRNDVAVGGLAREFYDAIRRHYGRDTSFRFESHVAERVYDDMLRRPEITIVRGKRLREPLPSAVEWRPSGKALQSIRTEDGSVYRAAVFIDATIEGDLLAAAGVSTVIGREPNSRYNETKNGIRAESTHAQFAVRVDPYRIPGDPASGLIPTIQDEPLGNPGDGDHRIQAFCFRLCLTRDPANRIQIEKPADYRESEYEIYRRYIRAGGRLFTPASNIPNGKTDLGSWHDLSANLYGMNHSYPGGSYAERRRIYDEHRSFVHGLLWFLVSDPAVPEALKEAWRPWGLCRDEFTGNAGWPRQLYIRDARRMVSDYVITEHHTVRTNPVTVPDPVALAYWPTDTHHVRRIVRDGAAYNEGFVFDDGNWGPFSISYRALVPRRAEAENLLTPTCVSSSHVAYGAIRIEFTFMALGQAAGAAAVHAIDEKCPVQSVRYETLRNTLIAAGQVLATNLTESKDGVRTDKPAPAPGTTP